MPLGMITLAEAKDLKSLDLSKKIVKMGNIRTPFFDSLTLGIPSSKDANVLEGHAWNYMQIPTIDSTQITTRKEGETAPPSSYIGSSRSLNHYAIFSEAFDISGSEDASSNVDGSKSASLQRAMLTDTLRKKIEIIFLSDEAPVQRIGKSTAGMMGGIGHWMGVHNSFEQTSKPLTKKMIHDLCFEAYINGMILDTVYVPKEQKDALDTIYGGDKTRGGTTSGESDDVVFIKDFSYAPRGLKIKISSDIDSDKMRFTSSENLMGVMHRPFAWDKLAKTGDSQKEMLIVELTLRVDNPFAVGELRGLKV